ncbi:MAG: four helix bundle protein [Clostridia bacterium]|nr:four helix bundle protein [Clostridia bacterium]
MAENKLVDLSFELAKTIVNMIDNITVTKSAYMVNQLARSATSIGANIYEAQYAHSKPDFIAKLEIALKEANETDYWLKLLVQTNRISEEEYKNAEKLCGNLRRLLIASCSTAKANLNNKNSKP